MERADVVMGKQQWTRALLVMVLVVAAVGCGGSDGGEELTSEGGDDVADVSVPSSAPASEGCEAVPFAGAGEEQERSVAVDGQERSYLLFVPAGIAAGEAAPLVLLHHGLPGTAAEMSRFSRFNETAEQEGLVAVYPDAGDGEWNLGDESDTDYVWAVIDDVAAAVCVDLSQVYATGFSQGGHMAGLLGCVAPDRVAAVGTVAAWTSPAFGAACRPASPMSVLFVVGAEDSLANPDSGYSCLGAPDCEVGPVTQEAAAWATNNGCELEPLETTGADGAVTWTYRCPSGRDVVVQMHGGQHTWPHALFDTNTTLWRFFSAQEG